MLTQEQIEKLQRLKNLASIPSNSGQQFIYVSVSIHSFNCGTIRFGLDWKSEMGEFDFYSLDEGIKEVEKIRARAYLG
jgi:hypothetical protein